MAKKHIVKPRLFQDGEQWWMDYEGHLTCEVHRSPNGRWASAVFRTQDSVSLILTDVRTVALRFPIAIPLVSGVSDAGVAATVEWGTGGEKRLCFFFSDGAMVHTENIKELRETDRIFFNKKFSEVNLLSEGRILNTVHFGDLEASFVPRSVIFRRDPFIVQSRIALAILAVLGFVGLFYFLR